MLLVSNEKILDLDIIHISCSKNWESNDTRVMVDCALIAVKETLKKLNNEGKKAVFLCECKIGTLPPPATVMQIVTFLLTSLSQLVESTLLCTVMNAKDKEQTFWLDQILKVYKPQKPLYIVYDDKDVEKNIKKHLPS